MRNRLTVNQSGGRLASRVRRRVSFASVSRRLLAAAALLHLTLALGLFWAGRAQVAPSLIDRDGIMGSFAFDSYDYRSAAMRLAGVLKESGVAAWAREREPTHVKLISLQFALLGSLCGYGTLSAEPFNLVCYLAVVVLTFALGREVGGERAGMIAACAVALWPTFLLHTLQLLKDPPFIAGAVALVLCATTWLTRTYKARGAVVAGALTVVAVALLLLIRSNFAVFIFALALFGFLLLVVRQLVERRLLYRNMICPLAILAAGALLLLSSHATRGGGEKLKRYPSDQMGQLKTVAGDGVPVPTVVAYLPRQHFDEETPTYAERLYAATRMTAQRLGSVRQRFAAIYPDSGSNIDSDVRIRDLRSLLSYLPRAFEIGCFAPFPNTWISAGKRVGGAGRLVSGAETLVMYAFELLALLALLRPPRRLAAWLLFLISVFGMTLLGLAVPNVGALYRFRYLFWMLLVVLGAKGVAIVLAWSKRKVVASAAQAAIGRA